MKRLMLTFLSIVCLFFSCTTEDEIFESFSLDKNSTNNTETAYTRECTYVNYDCTDENAVTCTTTIKFIEGNAIVFTKTEITASDKTSIGAASSEFLEYTALEDNTLIIKDTSYIDFEEIVLVSEETISINGVLFTKDCEFK